MKTKINALLIVVLIIMTFGCEDKTNDADVDINSINVYFSEDLDDDDKPVCLKFNISSVDKFDDTYLLEQSVLINGNDIVMEIGNIKNTGKCEYPQHLSAPKPENYKCPASTEYFNLDNLKRGIYNLEIAILDKSYNGILNIHDQYASLIFNDKNVIMFDSVIHIIPDSCIFGTYYSVNSDSVGFQEMINRLKSENCRQINVEQGIYRDFEIDNNGILNLNSGQTTQEPTFILKYDLNIEQVLNTLDEFVANSNDVYGIIFYDYLGNYYNIKK
jgi:hypothetical protein